jgi:2-aminoethylphosphonate-pyruvate transaminase
MLLLNPGPVTLSERVRNSLLNPDLCHREPEFFDLQDEARSRLLSTYELSPQQWSAVLMTASGTAAVESMVAALVPQGGRLLIAENGVYGDRIAQICAQYGIGHDRIIGDWMKPLDVDVVADRLSAKGNAPRFTHLAAVHHETTTGRLNDLKPLLALCRKHGIGLLLDGVSSFGAERIDFTDESLFAVAATANKCLHGVPGAAFVIARRSLLEQAASRTYYLDLARLARLQDTRSTPFTPSVHAYYALVEALREYEDLGGRAARYRHYATLAEQVRAGLNAAGMACVVPPEESSVVLRSYKLPVNRTYEQLHDALKAQGFVIYAGQGNLSKSLFRISTMGNLNAADITRLLASFSRLLQ